jgi:hypothetical protein
MFEVNGRRLRARVHPDGPRVEGLAVLGLDLEAVAGKGLPIAGEKKTTNFQLSDVQKVMSRPRDSAELRFSISILE